MGNELSLHDRLFRQTFGGAENSAAFFREFLPEAFCRQIDWSTLEPLPERYVDPKFRAAEVDLLFKARVSDRETLLYVLFEHQSSDCPTMPLRLLRYMTAIWQRWHRDNPSAKRLPLIVPMVLFHGSGPWTAPLDFAEMVHLPGALGDLPEVRAMVPSFCYQLTDLAHTSDARIKSIDLSALAKLVMRLFKHIHDKELGAQLPRWLNDFNSVLRGPHGLQNFHMLIDYLSKAGDGVSVDDIEAIGLKLGSEAGEIVMTVAEKLRQEGRQEGVEQGRRQLLLRLLKLKFGESLPTDAVETISSASLEDIDRWAERVLTAQSYTDVFR